MPTLVRRVLRRSALVGILVALLLVGAPIGDAVLGPPPATLLVYIVVPALVAAAEIGVSIRSIVRRFTAAQVLLGAAAIFLLVVAVWSLMIMAIDDGWPTYLPFYAIAFATPIVALQSFLARGESA